MDATEVMALDNIDIGHMPVVQADDLNRAIGGEFEKSFFIRRQVPASVCMIRNECIKFAIASKLDGQFNLFSIRIANSSQLRGRTAKQTAAQNEREAEDEFRFLYLTT